MAAKTAVLAVAATVAVVTVAAGAGPGDRLQPNTPVVPDLASVRTVPVPAQAPSAKCKWKAGTLLPDPVCTPGRADRVLTQKRICSPSFRTGPFRHVTDKTRRTVYASYGLTGSHPFPEWEVDHLISLQLGGSNSIRNLWPEWKPRAKDGVENSLRAAVCNGRMTLKQAQSIIATDWRTASVPHASATTMLPPLGPDGEDLR